MRRACEGFSAPLRGRRNGAESDVKFPFELQEQGGERRRRRSAESAPGARWSRRGPRADRRRARTSGSATAARARFLRGRGLCLASGRATARRRPPHQPCRDVAPQGHRSRARSSAREHRAICARPARQQRPAVGRAGHGQILAGQGRSRRRRRRASGRRAQARRNSPRGYRDAARAHGAFAPRIAAFHRLLRRPLLRRGRHLVQVAQDDARRRHRGAAGERHLLRHLQPPPHDGARHDRERTLDRDQSGRGGGGEGLAFRPLRIVARLPSLQPGRIPGHGRGLCRPLPRPDQRRGIARRSARMGDDARRPLRPRRLAIRAGSRGSAWGENG